MIQGLALFCALIFWAGLSFLLRWTLHLHVKSTYHGTDHAPQNKEDLQKEPGTTQVILQCCGPGTKILGAKAEMLFSLSPASFQSLFEEALTMVSNKLSRTAPPSAPDREASPEESKDPHLTRGSHIEWLQQIFLKTIQFFRVLFITWIKLKIILELRHKVKNILHRMTRKTEIQALCVTLRGGTGNAALTALMQGFLWMMWGHMLVRLNKHVKMTGQDIRLTIKPDFAWVGLDLDMISIVRLKMSHIIIKSIQLVRWVRKTL